MGTRLWSFFKTAGKFGWGGIALAILFSAVSLIEHLLDHNLAAYVMIVLGALAFCFGAYIAWDVEHQSYLSEVERHDTSRKIHEDTAIDLRAHIHDLQTSLVERGRELERAVNNNRPEVFIWPENSAIFKAYSISGIYARLVGESSESFHFACPEFAQVVNSGKSAAYQIDIPSIYTDAFSLHFASIPHLDVGAKTSISATLVASELPEAKDGTFHNATQDSGSITYYEVTDTINGKQIELSVGLRVKITWRDSSRNHFFSTYRNGLVSFIEAMDAPLTDEEMQAAYEQEDYENH
jgi:hypothetical protein